MIKDLQKMRTVINLSHIQFEGGEPLLHNKLIDFIHAVKDNNLAPKCGFTTNCTLIDKCTDELLSLVDLVKLSIYPEVVSAEKIDAFKDRIHQAGKEFAINEANEFWPCFRKTKEYFNSPECWLHRGCYVYINGYFFTCSAVHSLNMIVHNKVIDGVCLNDDNAAEQLESIISSDIQYDACNYCEMHKFQPVPWAQATKKEWMKIKGLPSSPNRTNDMG